MGGTIGVEENEFNACMSELSNASGTLRSSVKNVSYSGKNTLDSMDRILQTSANKNKLLATLEQFIASDVQAMAAIKDEIIIADANAKREVESLSVS